MLQKDDERGIALVAATEMFDTMTSQPPTDLGEIYLIKAVDQALLGSGNDTQQKLYYFLEEITHAAACGCKGCMDKVLARKRA